MTRKPLNMFVTLTLLSFLTFSNPTTLHASAKSYVKEACNVTRYQDICIKSLTSYSNTAKRSPKRWARAGVSVTIGEVKLVSQYLDRLLSHSHVRLSARNRAALSDCVECIQDTLDNLHQSLQVLRRLSVGTFDDQVNDVLTWLSAALTDEDTCIEGFEGRRRGKLISRVCERVLNASYVTSNALALANRLTTNGLELLD